MLTAAAPPPICSSTAPSTRMRPLALSRAASARARSHHNLAGKSFRTSLQYSRATCSVCASRVMGFMYCVIRPCGPTTLLKISAGSPVPCPTPCTPRCPNAFWHAYLRGQGKHRLGHVQGLTGAKRALVSVVMPRRNKGAHASTQQLQVRRLALPPLAI